MTELYVECMLLWCAGGFKAVRRYLEFIESKPSLVISQTLNDKGIKYRKDLLEEFRKMR